jgi:acetolactate synthase-1/2/3 large subunit
LATYAEVIANTLVRSGVEYVFGLPGGEITAFLDACRRLGCRFVLAGHETSAALMAQVFGQITGIPGVCASTLGPGATNLVTGVANAYLDRAPLLAITAQVSTALADTLTHQRLPLQAMFAPITKRSAAAGEGDAEELVLSSLALACAPRPGPVHLSLPSDLAVRECASRGSHVESPRADPVGSAKAIEEAAARIRSSQKPVVIIGLGAMPAMASSVRAFLERLGAPFLLTPKVKGILPEDHELYLGVASGMAMDAEVVETVRSADLVIGIGFDPVECDGAWFAEVETLAIDSVSMAEGRYRPLELIGHIPSLLGRLAERMGPPRPWPEESLRARRCALARSASPQRAAGAVSPLELIEALRSAFPRDGILTTDVGSHKLLFGQYWRSYTPGSFFMSNGLSGMGFGVAAAIAAQIACPDRAVMAVVGDGGMLMMCHDLLAITALKLPIIVVCVSDNSLSLIRVSQRRRGYPPYGVDFPAPDYSLIAEGFGLAGRKTRSISEVREAVERALERREALLLDVATDYREYYDLV